MTPTRVRCPHCGCYAQATPSPLGFFAPQRCQGCRKKWVPKNERERWTGELMEEQEDAA